MAFRFYKRSEWGAADARGRTWVGNSQAGVLHHTADALDDAKFILKGRPGKKWYALYRKGRLNASGRKLINAYESKKKNVVEAEKAHMRQIQKYHMSLGWYDIGYHRVIFPSGHVYEGRPLGVQGAHAKNGNHMTGYSFAGNFEVEMPTKQAVDSFEIMRSRDATKSFVGHFQVPGNSTACPGRNLKNYYKLV